MPDPGSARRKVLFLCTGNSCRSQMAEGLLRSMADGTGIEVCSAGTDPQDVHPGAIVAMQELGIDISQQRSEHVDAYVGAGVHTVVTVCDRAASSCPTFPGPVRRLYWNYEDPAATRGTEAERMTVFRQVRDDIARDVRAWLDAGCPA